MMLDHKVYRPWNTGLGDCLLSVNFLIHESRQDGLRKRISGITLYGDVTGKLREILDLMDCDCIEVVADPSAETIDQEFALSVAYPYAPTRIAWEPFIAHGRVSYQFDGRNNGIPKTPPSADVSRLLGWDQERTFTRLGDHLSLQECVASLATSDLFVGVCSGMSHLAHMVGVPVFLLQYQFETMPWHLGASPDLMTVCLGTDDFLAKVRSGAWCR